MSIKFTIDPGHVQNYNTGVITSYHEGTAMYNLGVYLKQELEKYKDFEAVLTRNSVTDDPSLSERGQLAVNNGSKVFISLHSDAYSATSCGVSIFRSLKLPASADIANTLGNKIASLMKQGTGVTYYRGTQTKVYPGTSNTDYYGVIRSSIGGNVKYSFLIEHGFHSNQKECNWLNNNSNLRALAATEAKVFADLFNKTLKDGEVSNIMTTTNVAETYEVVVDVLNGYSTAYDALNGTNPKTRLEKGTYYIFRRYTNGCINITKDSNGTTPGSWINPDKNQLSVSLEDIDTSELTPISMSVNNLPEYTFEQAVNYVRANNPNPKLTCTLEELVYSFMRAGYAENIRWDIAFAQSIKETGFFNYGGQVEYTQNNYAGIGATNGGAAGATFETPYIGALAQIQHLKAYCSNDDCTQELVDPRFRYVTRAWSPYLEWLGMNENPKNQIYNKTLGWAVPGDNYGASILTIINRIKNS